MEKLAFPDYFESCLNWIKLIFYCQCYLNTCTFFSSCALSLFSFSLRKYSPLASCLSTLIWRTSRILNVATQSIQIFKEPRPQCNAKKLQTVVIVLKLQKAFLVHFLLIDLPQVARFKYCNVSKEYHVWMDPKIKEAFYNFSGEIDLVSAHIISIGCQARNT